VVDLQGRIAAAREQQSRAMAAVREAQAQASEAGFSLRSTNSRSAALRVASDGWRSAHRSKAWSMTCR
jgi:adhesin transport system membrane fusion protein